MGVGFGFVVRVGVGVMTYKLCHVLFGIILCCVLLLCCVQLCCVVLWCIVWLWLLLRCGVSC